MLLAVSSWLDHVETRIRAMSFGSVPPTMALRGLIGAFWEDFDIKDDMNFLYKSIPSCTPANLVLYAAGPRLASPT